MMRVLVTGAQGFIGQHLVQRLVREGYRVRALAHGPGGEVRPQSGVDGVEWIVGDVRDARAMKEACAGCDGVLHLAAKVHAMKARSQDEAEYHAVNVEGTRNVLEGASSGGARRVIHFSSVKVFGEGAAECLDESRAPRPETAYGRSKLAAEHLVSEYGLREGLQVTSLRLPPVYGIGHKGNLCRMIAAIDRGMFPPLPDIRNRRSLLCVDNLVQAVLLIQDHQATFGRCYIVTDARAYGIGELYDLIRRSLGKPEPRWRVPIAAFRAGAVLGDLLAGLLRRPMPFDTQILDRLVGSEWYSSAALARDTGYRPARSFEEVLPQLIASYREGLA